VAVWPIMGMVAYFALDRRLHTRQQLAGMLVASSIFLITMLPHFLWLRRSDFLPFHYARSVAQSLPGLSQTMAGLAIFLFVQALRLVPFAFGAWFVLRRPAGLKAPRPVAYSLPDRRDKLFLWIAAV